MFYRPGGSATRINLQTDTVYSDTIGGATGWLPVSKGDTIAVNILRASLVFRSSADSDIISTPVMPEAQILLEQAMYAQDKASGQSVPIDQWQNMVVASSRTAHREGWVRLRIVNINNQDNTGVRMDLQVGRTGKSCEVS